MNASNHEAFARCSDSAQGYAVRPPSKVLLSIPSEWFVAFLLQQKPDVGRIDVDVIWLKVVDEHRRSVRGHCDVGLDVPGRAHVHCGEDVMDQVGLSWKIEVPSPAYLWCRMRRHSRRVE